MLFHHICYDFCVEIACMHGNIDMWYHVINQNMLTVKNVAKKLQKMYVTLNNVLNMLH